MILFPVRCHSPVLVPGYFSYSPMHLDASPRLNMPRIASAREDARPSPTKVSPPIQTAGVCRSLDDSELLLKNDELSTSHEGACFTMASFEQL